MEPVKVDELIHILGLAREDAKKMVAARSMRLPRGGNAVVRDIASGTVTLGKTVASGNKEMGTSKVQP
jgi:hypothetical protein